MTVLLDDMIRAIEAWLRILKEPEPYVDPNLDPVLIVPGIAGSILNAKDAETGKEERVWVRIWEADREFRDKLWCKFDPQSGKTMSLDPNISIVVPEDRDGLYAIDCLDPAMVIGRDSVCYFHDMINEMTSWGYQEGKTLFGFGYDFRQSNRLKETLDRLAAKLDSIYTASGGKKINVITHSMGGLLVKCFMSLHSDIFEKYVKSWIAIAAPFQVSYIFTLVVNSTSVPIRSIWNGSVKHSVREPGLDFSVWYSFSFGSWNHIQQWWEQLAKSNHFTYFIAPIFIYILLNELTGAPGYVTSTLMNGMSFVDGWEAYFFVSKWSMHQLLIECPSIYELMACLDHEWEHVPLLQIWKEIQDGNGNSTAMLETFTPIEAVSIFTQALSINELSYGGVDIPLPFNKEILQWANKTREILSSAKLPPSVKFYNVYGTGLDTPQSVCYGSADSPILDLQELPLLDATYINVNGDGTVPVESSKADGLDAEARVGIPGEHRGILCDKHLFRIVKHWLKADHDPFYNPVNDYVILPTLFEIERHSDNKGKEVTSLKEEWEIVSEDEREPMVGSISASCVGDDLSSSQEAHATFVVHPQSNGTQHVEVSAMSVTAGV